MEPTPKPRKQFPTPEKLVEALDATDRLILHLRECWPIAGNAAPIAGVPTHSTYMELSWRKMEVESSLGIVPPPIFPGDPTKQPRVEGWQIEFVGPIENLRNAYRRIANLFHPEETEPIPEPYLSSKELNPQGQFAVRKAFCVSMTSEERIECDRFGLIGPLNRLPQIDPADMATVEWSVAKLRGLLGNPAGEQKSRLEKEPHLALTTGAPSIGDNYSRHLVGNQISDPTPPMSISQIAKYIWGKKAVSGNGAKAAKQRALDWMKEGRLPANITKGKGMYFSK